MKKIILTVSADLKEAQESAKNTLLASERSKQVARLINSNIMPESWCAGYLSPPTSIAPIENPELLTLSQGSPEQFLKTIPLVLAVLNDTMAACAASEQNGQNIQVDIQLIPRPTALIESIRRYQGL